MYIIMLYNQSDCSQEAVDRLKQRVDYLESKLEEVSALVKSLAVTVLYSKDSSVLCGEHRNFLPLKG